MSTALSHTGIPATAAPAASAPVAEWARFYVEVLGWALTPIPRGQKGPTGNGWNRPRSDQNPKGYVVDPALAAKIWAHGGNLGVVLGPSRLATLDVDDVEGATGALRAVGVDLARLLASAVRIEGNPAKAKALYRVPDGVDLKTFRLRWPAQEPTGKPITVLELRAGPLQDVLPPSIHPETNRPYRWITSPWENGCIPTLPAEILGLWQTWDHHESAMRAACPWAADRSDPPPNVARAAREFLVERDEVREEIRRRVPLEELLEQLGATRAGPGRWHCPFHPPDRDPSFWTYETQGRVQLWADGHGEAPVGRRSRSGYGVGDVIDLYQHLHRVTFLEAVTALARELGIALPASTGPAATARQPSTGRAAASDTPAVEDLDKECVGFRCTDNDNGKRLVLRFGHLLRHTPALGWLAWDGRRWAVDDHGQAAEFAKETARRIYAEASLMDGKAASETRSRWASASCMGRGRREILAAAQSDPAVRIDVERLDQDPRLLNVGNGTVDLCTGELRPHTQDDYISKLAGTIYDPTATCPLVDRFLAEIMNGHEAMIRYLWRAVGYSLTGLTGERALFFLYGDGANGKSTWINLIRELLGDYGMQTPAETLLAKKAGAIPNDIARLRGARFVATVEVEDGRRLAEALVKQITGGDAVPARFMHQEWFEYVPTYKLWLAANHKPVIRGTDNAIWERMRLIPFSVTIPKDRRDKELPSKLRTELPGVLRRAVEGCLKWQAAGLQEPAEVMAATQGFRDESDGFRAFLDERCILSLDAETAAGDFRSAYEDWCKENGEEPLRQKAVAERLRALRCENKRGTGGYFRWHGLGLVK